MKENTTSLRLTLTLTLTLTLFTMNACATTAEIERNPYTADQILRLLRGAVSLERILHDAERECIAFQVTPELSQQLLDAGATQAFIDALSTICRTAPQPLRLSASQPLGSASQPLSLSASR